MTQVNSRANYPVRRMPRVQLQRAQKTHQNQALISTPQRVTSTLFITDKASEEKAGMAVPPGKVLE